VLSKASTVLLNLLVGIPLSKCPSPTLCHWNRNSPVRAEISYGLGDTGFISRQDQKIFSSLFHGYQGSSGGIERRGVKLTAHLI